MSNPSPVQRFTEGPAGNTNNEVGARLCHFRSGSSQLLEAHKHWIVTYFVPKMQQHPNAWVDLIGSASPVGNAAANRALSHQRIMSVESFIKSKYPALRFNVRQAEGADDAARFQINAQNNDGFWRAVVVRWWNPSTPIVIPTPSYPPEAPPTIKLAKMKAPKGCWCIIGVDSFGLPLKAGVAAGKVELTLLNDKAEKWVLRGYGAGGGVGLNTDPKIVGEAAKIGASTKVAQIVSDALKEIGLKSGDLQNVSEKIKNLKITGPSDTAGGIMRRGTWAANLTINDIVAAGFFIISNVEGSLIMAGMEPGLIVFGLPFTIGSGTPWGCYTSAGLGTMKVALGLGSTAYYLSSYEKLKS